MDCVGITLPLEPEFSVHLGENIFCVTSKFQGQTYVHVREYGKGKLRYFPRGRGVAVKAVDFLNFLDNCDAYREIIETSVKSRTLFWKGISE